ncbi:MAG: hypothetical protein LBO74_14835 [Candidatus Symbiothrix sp.]|jgi:hypothetical protein|nr:hypothetical protein [Candidatus Symbiothrix sp.]
MNYAKYILFLVGIILAITSCVDEKDDYIVGYVHTQAVSSIESISALCGGELKIIGKGNGVRITIEENGILYSEDTTNFNLQIVSATISSNKHLTKAKYVVSNQTKEGDFSCRLDNLTPYTHYYARAYSVIICSYPNDKNLSYRNILYGDTKEFLTNPNDGSGNGNDTIPLTPIILSKPDSLTAHIWMSNCIWVQWKKVPDAVTYEIWRSSSGQEGSYSLIYSGDCDWFDNCHYEDCKPLPENNYYKIKARNGFFESVFSDSVYCNFSLTNIDPCWVEITSITGDASALTIVWQYSTDTRCGTPEKYIVKKRNTEGQYEFVAETISNRYKDTLVHPGLNRYCVAAVNDNSESECYESILSPQIPFVFAPSEVTACMSGQNVTVSWNPVPWATGYQIYAALSSPDDNNSYLLEINGEIEGNVSSWTGTVYYKEPVYYKVRAVWFSRYIGGSPEYSALSANYAKVSAAP